jgi:hypothetical protein
MHDAERRLQFELHLGPIERLLKVRRFVVRIVMQAVVEVRRVFRQGIILAEQVGELLRHIGGVALVVINSQGAIALALVGSRHSNALF